MRVGRIESLRGQSEKSPLQPAAFPEEWRLVGKFGVFLLRQLLVLRFGSFQDRQIRVGVLPQGEQVLVGGARFGGPGVYPARGALACTWSLFTVAEG